MKRILGSGYILKQYENKNDTTIQVNTTVETPLAFKIKIPECLMPLFTSHGSIWNQVDNSTEYYVPTYFKKTDGTPVSVKESVELNTKFLNYYRFLSNFYSKLEKQGIMTEQLVYLLPFGIFGTYFWMTTADELMKLIDSTLDSNIPEYKEISQALLSYLKESFPKTTSDFLSRRKKV